MHIAVEYCNRPSTQIRAPILVEKVKGKHEAAFRIAGLDIRVFGSDDLRSRALSG
jgi:hypothetical protein